MRVGVAHPQHLEAREIVPSDPCVHRFGARVPVRQPGIAQVATELLAALEAADISAWPPA